VRANAAALLVDVFPLQSDDTSPQVAEELMQRQFDAFKVICLFIYTLYTRFVGFVMQTLLNF